METHVSSHSASEPVSSHHPKGADNVALISLAKSCDRPTSFGKPRALRQHPNVEEGTAPRARKVLLGKAYFFRLCFLWAHLEPWKSGPSQDLTHINHSSLPPWQVLWIFSSLNSWQASPQSRLQLDLRGLWAETGNWGSPASWLGRRGLPRRWRQRKQLDVEAGVLASRWLWWRPSTSLSCKMITHCIGFLWVVLMVK